MELKLLNGMFPFFHYRQKESVAVLNIAVCDDQKIWLENTVGLLNDYYADHNDISVKIYAFQSAYDLLESVDEGAGFDLYILDVMMPEMTGIQVGAKLRAAEKRGLIIYLTTSKDFALDAYSVQPFHYLIKPVEKDSLFAVLNKATAILKNRHTKAISVKTKEGTEQLLFDNIVYVEFAERRCHFHLQNGDVVIGNQLHASFSEIVSPLLKDDRFCRCGASYVLNLFYISAIEKELIRFRNSDKTLYLPRSANNTLMPLWLDYWIERGNNI